MKRVIKKILMGIVFASFLFIGLAIIRYFNNTLMPWERNDAIRTTLLWSGLSELPDNHRNLEVEKSGNMFTRTFLLEFNLPERELKRWIANSKRLKEQTPLNQDDGSKLYEIYPGEEGAMGGTVHVDFQNGHVKIKMSWS